MTKKALPYDVLKDFTFTNTLHGASSSNAWNMIATPDCDATSFPAFPVIGDGGVDASADAATVSDAADGGVVDAPVDAPVGDASASDGGAASCIEMTYDPDACIALGGDTGNNCWDGVIFAPTSTIGLGAPGICIDPTATKITFEARASRSLLVKFGGAGSGDGSGVFEFFEPLTTSWQSFSVDSPAGVPNYNTTGSPGVWNGFSIVATPTDGAGGVYILVRNVRWAK